MKNIWVDYFNMNLSPNALVRKVNKLFFVSLVAPLH